MTVLTTKQLTNYLLVLLVIIASASQIGVNAQCNHGHHHHGHHHDHGHHHHGHHHHDHDHHGHAHADHDPIYGAGEAAEELPVDEKEVVQLSTANFQETISENEFVMVAFVEPGSPHSKLLAFAYAEVANSFAHENSPIIVGKIDGPANQEITNKYNIQGYPTLLLFRKTNPVEYNGGRSIAEMVNWLKRKSGPISKHLNSKQDIQDYLAADGIKIVAHIANEEQKLEWESSLDQHSELYSIGHVMDSSLVDDFTPGTFSVHKKDEAVITFKGEFVKSAIIPFVASAVEPPIRDLDQDLFSLCESSNAPLVAIFTKKNVDLSEYKPIAASFRGKAYFGWHYSAQMAERWGATGKKIPTAIIIRWNEDKKQKYTVFDEENEFTPASLATFVTEALAGTYKSYKKSEAIPESNEPVRKIVGKQFEQIVFDPTKHVFVEYYTPWCSECKKLEPTLQELATFFSENDKIIIGKMDCTQNAFPTEDITVDKYPTVIFYPTSLKQGIPFTGENNFENFKTFITKHSGASEQ